MITPFFNTPPTTPVVITLEFCLWLHRYFDELLEVLNDECR